MPGYNTGDATLTSIVPLFCQTRAMNGDLMLPKKRLMGGGVWPKEYNLAAY